MTDGHEWTVTKNWDGNHKDRLVEDGVREMTIRAQWILVMRTFGKGTTDRDTVMIVRVWQAAEAFKTRTRVTRRLVRILDRSAASSSVHSTYKNQHLSFIFLLWAETSLSKRVHHLSELTRSHPSATRPTRSLLSSVSDPIRSSHCYTFNFYDRHGRSIKFLVLVSSPLFYFRPPVLGFCHSL